MSIVLSCSAIGILCALLIVVFMSLSALKKRMQRTDGVIAALESELHPDSGSVSTVEGKISEHDQRFFDVESKLKVVGQRLLAVPSDLNAQLQELDCRTRDHWDEMLRLQRRLNALEIRINDSTSEKMDDGSVASVIASVRDDPNDNGGNGLDERNQGRLRDDLDRIRRRIIDRCEIRKPFREFVAATFDEDDEESIRRAVREYVGSRIWIGQYEERYALFYARERDQESAISTVIRTVCKDNEVRHFGLLKENLLSTEMVSAGETCNVYGFGIVDDNAPHAVIGEEDVWQLDYRVSQGSQQIFRECINWANNIPDKGSWFLKIKDRRMVAQRVGTQQHPRTICNGKFATELEAWLCLECLAKKWPCANVLMNVQRELTRLDSTR